ncbi:hypothetical protein [Clostridium septicum]|uniref:hypothetical protein n=1 Tax=Clostridium septicum TaxID=1504 RepID=UPI000833EF31|nr:hypothetical protein [Clostridium septicum]
MDNSTVNQSTITDNQNNATENGVNNSNVNNDTELSAEQQRFINILVKEKALEIAQKDFELRLLKNKSFELLKENGFKEDYHEMLSEFINYDSEEKCVESIEKLTIVINTLLEPLLNDRLRGTSVPRAYAKMVESSKKADTTFSDAVKTIKNKFNQ